jgi:hypothetical protein
MKLLPESKMQISIVDDSTNHVCTDNCGLDWSSPEILDTVKQQVMDRFGSNIDITYIDLSKAVDIKVIQKVKPLVCDLSMPVLLVNNKPRIAGEFDSRRLIDVIEVELEVGMV